MDIITFSTVSICRRLCFVALVCTVLTASATLAAYDLDTTRVRTQPVEQPKSVGEKILIVPQFVVGLPVTATKLLADVAVNDVLLSGPSRKIMSLFGKVDRVWGFAPVGGYGSNLGLKLGLGFWSEGIITKGERFDIKGYYSTNDYQRYKIRYAAPNKLGTIKRLFVLADYKKRPRETFYGLGIDSRIEDRVSFTLERLILATGWYHQLHDNARLDLETSYFAGNTFDGRTSDIAGHLNEIQQRFGLDDHEIQATRLWSSGATLTHDWRNNPGQPSAGGYESLSISYNRGLGDYDELQYLHSRVSLHHYFNIYRKRLLALRVLAEVTDRLGDSPDLPFYLRPSLGGETDLRAYRSRRFVDHSLTLVSLEYRWPIWNVVDAFLFIDEGRTFNAISEDFTLKNWQYSVGGGLRIWQEDGLLFSMLIGTGKEGSRFYFQVSEEM
jgi:outer membrane protein assembly factor BamA